MDEKEVLLVLKQMLELLNDRPDDMYDEEGFPTDELNTLVGRMKQIVAEAEER